MEPSFDHTTVVEYPVPTIQVSVKEVPLVTETEEDVNVTDGVHLTCCGEGSGSVVGRIHKGILCGHTHNIGSTRGQSSQLVAPCVVG